MSEQTTEAAVAAAAQKVSAAGGGAALVGGLTANEFAAFGGLFVAIVGVLIQWHYGRKRNQREAEYHAARLMWREDDGEG